MQRTKLADNVWGYLQANMYESNSVTAPWYTGIQSVVSAAQHASLVQICSMHTLSEYFQ